MNVINKLKNHLDIQQLQLIELELCIHRILLKQLIVVIISKSITITTHSIISITVVTTITALVDLLTIASIITLITSIVLVQQVITLTSHCINSMKMIQLEVLTMMYSRASLPLDTLRMTKIMKNP